MPDYNASETLPDNFHAAARPEAPVNQPPKVTAPELVDADVLTWFQSEANPADWRKHINGVLRFYMDTNMLREEDFRAAVEARAGEPHP